MPVDTLSQVRTPIAGSYELRECLSTMPAPSTRTPKHAEISESLRKAIDAGEYGSGDRLPSEHQLVSTFQVSRPTVSRALRELQHSGLIERRVGSGTFVRIRGPVACNRQLFGLLIPDLGHTEIFEPICGQIAREAQTRNASLIWGDLGDVNDDADRRAILAEAACQSYIDQKVSGVFFAPVEYTTDDGMANRRILDKLSAARIPVVLLDRDAVDFNRRSDHDLVGIDNLRAGYLLANHLIEHGHRRIGFLARHRSASTTVRRMAGFREAMWQHEIDVRHEWIRFGDPEQSEFARDLINSGDLDAVICANDDTAAMLLRTLNTLQIDVPGRIAIAGFDDVKYAKLLGVPLTTVAQPCQEIGVAAVNTMLSRISDPELPPRTVLLEPSLVIRESCGQDRHDSSK